MTRRKALPYAATALVDDALMALAEARRQMRPILDESNDLKIVVRTGKALDEINRALANLLEVKMIEVTND